MNLKLKNKVILVTGGSKGIGYGICEVLLNEGAIPVIIDRDKRGILSAIKNLKAKEGEFYTVVTELKDLKNCKLTVDKVIQRYGRIEGLVNNAGVNDGVGLENGNVNDFLNSINSNLSHYYSMAKLVLPELKKNKGTIVNIASKIAFTGQGGTSGYAASNGGRIAVTEEWALELLSYGIRVNSVIVAECFTDAYSKWLKTFPKPKEKLKLIIDKIPLGKRMTTTTEIGNTVAFLLSERSIGLNGQLVHVDGGYTHLDRSIS